jgi:hypothetical protein
MSDKKVCNSTVRCFNRIRLIVYLKYVQISVNNTSNYALQPNEPSTVTVQGKLVSKPEEV